MTTRGRRFLDVVPVGASFVVVLMMRLVIVANGLELESSCFDPLGMQTGTIQDSALSASTSYDASSVGPHHARLENNKQGGAWCPRHMVSRSSREYLEIDLKNLHVITGIKTQGRFGNGQGQEYAEQYMVEYWRDGLQQWIRWRDRRGKELLSGNTDTFTVVEQSLNPPPISSKVRIFPYSDHVRTVCMRIELTGCLFKDGLRSYSMPQGSHRTDLLDLSDKTYDGTEENGQLSNGLGQLTDGAKGRDNFRLDINGFGKGYEWIGWRNDTPGWASLPLEILFEFDRVRNFSAAHLYTNNMFTKDVQVFSHARTFFSLNGRKFSPEPVHFSYMPDLVMEHARNVTIKLHHRVGKFLKLQLYFASKWILLSEVSFDSAAIDGNFTQETEPEMGATLPDFVGREYPIQRDEVKAAASPKGGQPRRVMGPEDANPPRQNSVSDNATAQSKNYIGFVIGILALIIFVLTMAIVLIVMKSQKIKQALNSLPGAIGRNAVETEKESISDKTKEKVYTESSSAFYSPTAVPPANYPDVPDLVSKNHPSSIETKELSPPPPPVPPPPQHYYASDVFSGSSSTTLALTNRLSARSRLILPLSSLQMSENGYTEEAISQNYSINKISSEKLRPIEKIGKGQFGELHLCELVGTSLRKRDSSVMSSNTVTNPTSEFDLCVMYTLDDSEYLTEFVREVKMLSTLNDRNVAMLLGASLENGPPYYSVREYAQFGDLCQFLQEHVAESTTAIASNASVLSYGCLIHIATQIASAMKHLELQKFVHKDLAARNCIVDMNYHVKVTDLGRYRDLYAQDYCQIGTSAEPAPLRWMAWESALLGAYSSKSDVWSFAVLFWEILTFAREQPFDWLVDDELLDNLAHFYQNDGKQLYLCVPRNCPKEIYDLMMECWNRNETDRPTFREIHLFLQRKNLGYDPTMH